jgi:hypothetical protein
MFFETLVCQLPAEPPMCRSVLICSMLHLTGPDDEGLHQCGSTKPLRLRERKAGTKAPEVRILAYQTQLSLARYIRLTMSITPPTNIADAPHTALWPPQNPFLFVVKFIILPRCSILPRWSVVARVSVGSMPCCTVGYSLYIYGFSGSCKVRHVIW